MEKEKKWENGELTGQPTTAALNFISRISFAEKRKLQ